MAKKRQAESGGRELNGLIGLGKATREGIRQILRTVVALASRYI